MIIVVDLNKTSFLKNYEFFGFHGLDSYGMDKLWGKTSIPIVSFRRNLANFTNQHYFSTSIRF